MLRRGISTLDELILADQLARSREVDTAISVNLYDQVAGLPNANRLRERILLWQTDHKGAFKRTYKARFQAFDIAALDRIVQSLPKSEPIRVHDMAVSDGRTAIDFYEQLSGKGFTLDFCASDNEPFLSVVQSGRISVVFDSRRRVVEIVWPPFVLNNRISRRLPFNRALKYMLQRFVVPRLIRSLDRGELHSREFSLFDPQVQAMRVERPDFHLKQYDLLGSHPQPIQDHIVRAMNVLNLSYFNSAQMDCALRNIITSLHPGGFLITGSNQGPDSEVNGGLYRRVQNRLIEDWRSGSGSPVHEIIVSQHV